MLRKRISLQGSSLTLHFLTFLVFIVVHYFVTHTWYRLSYMHAYLLSHFLPSLSLFCGVVRRRKRQGWVLPYLEESSLKWATVIHQLPSSPWRPRGSAHSLEIPQDSALFLYLRFILFLSLHISLSISRSTALLLWPLAIAACYVSFPPLPQSVGMIFCQILIQTSLTTETLHTVLSLPPVLFKSTDSRSDPFSLLLCLNFVQGGPDAPRHAQAARVHPLRVHLGHSLPHRLHPDALRGRVHPRRRLHRAGAAFRGQEVQRLARSASLKVVALDPERVRGLFSETGSPCDDLLLRLGSVPG